MTATALKEAPPTFGSSQIVTINGLPHPVRNDAFTALPRLNPGTALYPLLGGEQFVFTTEEGVASSDVGPRTFFGGTDEMPFLVELHPWHSHVLLENGEEAFYASLKPASIKRLEKLYGAQGTVRQGDIYAYALPISSAEMGRLSPDKRLQVRSVALFGTRHILRDGYWIKVIQIKLPNGSMRFSPVVEGTLTAPDHASRHLAGPHLIARSQSMISSDPSSGVGD